MKMLGSNMCNPARLSKATSRSPSGRIPLQEVHNAVLVAVKVAQQFQSMVSLLVAQQIRNLGSFEQEESPFAGTTADLKDPQAVSDSEKIPVAELLRSSYPHVSPLKRREHRIRAAPTLILRLRMPLVQRRR